MSWITAISGDERGLDFSVVTTGKLSLLFHIIRWQTHRLLGCRFKQEGNTSLEKEHLDMVLRRAIKYQ